MTISVLYYFVDTNLFIQCRPVEEIDWSQCQEFEEVRLIVSSPVLREIDHLKTKGNGRVGKRARATSAMLREMLETTHKQVHAESPRVVLSIEPQHTYDPNDKDHLDYQERDDQLLGTVQEYARSNPTRDVRLLTHDTLPLFRARGLNLTADSIPDEWLLPPETTETEKELAALKAENVRLKSSEPSISIRCIGQSDIVIGKYCVSYTIFEPLTNAEVAELMETLKVRFPLETEFGSRESAKRPAPSKVAKQLIAVNSIYTPATDEEIDKYREEAYPQWLNHCEKMLRAHHRVLQQEMQALEFAFIAQNVGTRPATDALIKIEARGDFQIMPPSPDDPEEGQEDKDKTQVDLSANVLPQPPVAPRGSWQKRIVGQLGDMMSAFDRFSHSQYLYAGSEQVDLLSRFNRLEALSSSLPPQSDPNEFYYKPDLPSMPQNSFELECAQWRHGDEEETFAGEIHVPSDLHEVTGLLVCRIQASNLSNSMFSQVPVRIAITHVSAVESARRMVETLAEFQDSQTD